MKRIVLILLALTSLQMTQVGVFEKGIRTGVGLCSAEEVNYERI